MRFGKHKNDTEGEAVPSQNKLLTTVAWQLGGKRTYALEGSVFIGGAVVQWLRDGLGVIVTLHQVDYAIRYCDRVIALQGGKIVYDGPSTALDQARLIEIYGPEFEDAFWETKA